MPGAIAASLFSCQLTWCFAIMRRMRFSFYELRTTDLDAAQKFYAQVLGWEWQSSETGGSWLCGSRPVAAATLLSARARERGAPAHWLGHVAVPEVEGVVSQLTALGGEQLGPIIESSRGKVAALRDPQGAVFGVSTRGDGPSPAVVWHELHTTDEEAALKAYTALFAWQPKDTLTLDRNVGTYRTFAWDDVGKSIGGMVGTARAPQVHTHWLFYLAVHDIDSAAQRVRTLGGTVYDGPLVLPSGDRIALCADVQGAVFGLREQTSPIHPHSTSS